MPRPPAWVTAAASFPPAAEPIGASRIGCWIPNSRVSAVSMVAIAVPRLKHIPSGCNQPDGICLCDHHHPCAHFRTEGTARGSLCPEIALTLGCQLVLCAELEIARVVPFMQLVRGIALQPVDDAPALDRGALADQVGPALDVLVVLDRQELAG